MRAQIVDAERPSEIGLVPSGEQLGHVPEIAQPVIDRSGREHVEGLRALCTIQQVVQPVVAGRLFTIITITSGARVPEMVRLIDNHDVCQFGNAPKPLREVALPVQIGVAEDGQVAEVGTASDTTDVWQPFTQVRLPDALLRSLRGKQHDSFALMENQPFD